MDPHAACIHLLSLSVVQELARVEHLPVEVEKRTRAQGVAPVEERQQALGSGRGPRSGRFQEEIIDQCMDSDLACGQFPHTHRSNRIPAGP